MPADCPETRDADVLATRLLESLAGLDLTSAAGAILQQAARIELRALGLSPRAGR